MLPLVVKRFAKFLITMSVGRSTEKLYQQTNQGAKLLIRLAYFKIFVIFVTYKTYFYQDILGTVCPTEDCYKFINEAKIPNKIIEYTVFGNDGEEKTYKKKENTPDPEVSTPAPPPPQPKKKPK